jgi:hypothetical protein
MGGRAAHDWQSSYSYREDNMPPTFPPPVVRTLDTLGKGPVPKGPVIIHLESRAWEKISRPWEPSGGKPRKGSKGLLVIPDPFGDFHLIPICVTGSGQGVACVPVITSSPGGGWTFGGGCHCFRGDDPKEEGPGQPSKPSDSCGVTITPSGIRCTGGCARTMPMRRCRIMKKTMSGGRFFIACECG